MANVFNPKNSQWEIDTASSDEATFQGTSKLYVKGVRWVGATTAGHVCEIQEPGGKVLFRSVADGSNFIDSELVEDWWADGFKVPTLQSGKLYINEG